MFCAASRYQMSPRNLAEMVRAFGEQLIARLSRQPGFRGFMLLSKLDGELMALNFLDSKEQASAWAQNPEHREFEARLETLPAGASKEDSYEVQATVFSMPVPAKTMRATTSKVTDVLLAQSHKRYLTG